MIGENQLELADTYLITGDNPKDVTAFLKLLSSCLQRGISLVQLRARQLSNSEYKKLAEKALRICRQYNAKLMLNYDVNLVNELNADGIHLNSARLSTCQKRPLDKTKIVSASCHNAQELKHAEKIGVDFVTLSPVLPTASHVGCATLGWDNFAKLSSLAKVPVYALGGIGTHDIDLAKQHGAHGIAGISALWEG